MIGAEAIGSRELEWRLAEMWPHLPSGKPPPDTGFAVRATLLSIKSPASSLLAGNFRRLNLSAVINSGQIDLRKSLSPHCLVASFLEKSLSNGIWPPDPHPFGTCPPHYPTSITSILNKPD